MKRAARGAATPDPAATVKDKHKRGKPAHVPTKKSRKRVGLLAGMGFTQEEICLLIDLGETALKRYYSVELRVGMLQWDEKVLTRMNRIIEKGNDADAGRFGIFFLKVRRRWHEVQRVIHGYDPEMIAAFQKSVIAMFRREIPENCPACKVKLGLPEKIAQHLHKLSQEMAAKLPQSEIVPMPRPELAGDHLEP